MGTGIAVFAYNRSWHLEQVLDGLKKNNVDKLYIFQDGLRCEHHRTEWEKTKKVIENIQWCEKVYYLSDCNRGLAESIVSGVNQVLSENDTVIVLEDDCVPAPQFINFMCQCFEKYKENKDVYSVSGYSWPINLQKTEYDIYGCGRISSWGWGTWKDRWEECKVDCSILKRIKEDPEKERYLATWGIDCEQMLLDNVAGKNDSWAIYWALHVIEQKAICINPYQSLIQNIGFDGTGVHCGRGNEFQVAVSEVPGQEFKFPEKITISDETEQAFASLYGSYTAASHEDKSKENVLIYGLGNFYFQNEKKINDEYNIRGFIDRKKKGSFAGRKIISADEIKEYTFDKIILMMKDIQQCIDISRNLISSQNISYQQIVLGVGLYGNYSKRLDKITVTSDGALKIVIGNISVEVRSKDEFYNTCEVFTDEIYHYFVNNERKDIVIDIGMNIGDAVLYFLDQDKVQKVYAYEPFRETFLAAENNLREYTGDTEKLEIFQFGISKENARRKIDFQSNMSCGQSTLPEVRERAYHLYETMGLVDSNNEKEEVIEVRKASEVVLPIIQRHSDCNIILKMDCEGEEYDIIEELSGREALGHFDFIMLEWHYRGKECILQHLRKAGYSYWCNDKSKDMGLIYAYR